MLYPRSQFRGRRHRFRLPKCWMSRAGMREHVDSRARCKPHIERVEEDAVRIVWVHGDSLVVPVLGIIACGIRAVSERAALRTFHVSPARATVCGSPGTQLAATGAAAAIAIRNNRLALRVNVIRVAWRDSDVNSPELV